MTLPLVAMGLAVTLAGQPVFAQTQRVDCTEITDCNNRLIEAKRLHNIGEDEESLKQLHSLFEKYHDPILLLLIAKQSHLLGHLPEAITFYNKYLASGYEKDKRKIVQVQSQLEQARAQQASAAPHSSATLSLNASAVLPPGSESIPSRQSNSSKSVPLYKRWWLWTIVGSSVVSAAIIVSLSVYAAPPNYPESADLHPYP